MASQARPSAPDWVESHQQLYRLSLKPPDPEGATLCSNAEECLQIFCDTSASVVRRRYHGLILRKIIDSNPLVLNHLKSTPNGLVRLGDVILGGAEMEETKIVAGLVLRESLKHGFDFANFWRSTKIPNSAPNAIFPSERSSTWMKGFQAYLDNLTALRLANITTDPGLLWAISLVASDGVKWRDSDAAFLLVVKQTTSFTIIIPETKTAEIGFVDIPLVNFRSATIRKAHLYDSQSRNAEVEAWETVLNLSSDRATYLFNTTERRGEEVAVLFSNREDALQCQYFIREILSPRHRAQASPASSIQKVSSSGVLDISRSQAMPASSKPRASSSEALYISRSEQPEDIKSHPREEKSQPSTMAITSDRNLERGRSESERLPIGNIQNSGAADESHPRAAEFPKELRPKKSVPGALPTIRNPEKKPSNKHALEVPVDDEYAFPSEDSPVQKNAKSTLKKGRLPPKARRSVATVGKTQNPGVTKSTMSSTTSRQVQEVNNTEDDEDSITSLKAHNPAESTIKPQGTEKPNSKTALSKPRQVPRSSGQRNVSKGARTMLAGDMDDASDIYTIPREHESKGKKRAHRGSNKAVGHYNEDESEEYDDSGSDYVETKKTKTHQGPSKPKSSRKRLPSKTTSSSLPKSAASRSRKKVAQAAVAISPKKHPVLTKLSNSQPVSIKHLGGLSVDDDANPRSTSRHIDIDESDNPKELEGPANDQGHAQLKADDELTVDDELQEVTEDWENEKPAHPSSQDSGIRSTSILKPTENEKEKSTSSKATMNDTGVSESALLKDTEVHPGPPSFPPDMAADESVPAAGSPHRIRSDGPINPHLALATAEAEETMQPYAVGQEIETVPGPSQRLKEKNTYTIAGTGIGDATTQLNRTMQLKELPVLTAMDATISTKSQSVSHKRKHTWSLPPATPDAKRVKQLPKDQGTHTRQDDKEEDKLVTTQILMADNSNSPCDNRKRAHQMMAPDNEGGDHTMSVSGKDNLCVSGAIEGTSYDGHRKWTDVAPQNSTEYDRTPAKRLTQRAHSGSSFSIEILSSNSKPLPASPHAESTAISGHVDRTYAEIEQELGQRATARNNPFIRRTKATPTQFARRLTEEFAGDDELEFLDSSPMKPPKSSQAMRLPIQSRQAKVPSPAIIEKKAKHRATAMPATLKGRSRAQLMKPTVQVSVQSAPQQAVRDTQPRSFGSQPMPVTNMEEDDTLVDNFEDLPRGSKQPPTNMPSSPPWDDPSSSHSSTSAEPEDEDPEHSSPGSVGLTEEMEWERSLQPHQRAILDELSRISKRLLSHIVDHETAVSDIVEVYEKDADRLLQLLVKQQTKESAHVFEEVQRKKTAMKKEFETLATTLDLQRRRFAE